MDRLRLLAITASILLPLPTLAETRLADCDAKPYDVTVINGGQTHVVTVSPWGGEIAEYGPTVTFKIAGQAPVTITEPDDEYCIWNGKIKIQRLDAGNEAHGGGQR